MNAKPAATHTAKCGPPVTLPPHSGNATAASIARILISRRKSPHYRYRGTNWPRFLDKLSEPQLAMLVAWVLDPALSYERISSKALSDFGVSISVHSLFRFRTHAMALLGECDGQPVQVLFSNDEIEILLRRKKAA